MASTRNTSDKLPDLASLPPDARIRLPDVLRLFPVSRASFMEGCRRGIYPPPMKAGPRLNTWRLGDILALCRGEWQPQSKAA